MASDSSGVWPPSDETRAGAQIITSTLAEPAIFYDPETYEPAPAAPAAQAVPVTPAAPAEPARALPGDLYAALGRGDAGEPTGETLAELARMGAPTTPLYAVAPAAHAAPSIGTGTGTSTTPHEGASGEADEPDTADVADGADLWASLSEQPNPTSSASGVHALRSLLLGSGPDYDARLALIEQRLEQLALYVTSEVSAARAEAARVPDLGQRIDTLAARVEDALDLARGGDVSLSALGTLQEQVTALRQEQAGLSQTLDARLRALDDVTRLRQREVRTAQRAELLRLRQRLYAPPETLGSSRLRAVARRAEERAIGSSGAGALSGPALATMRRGRDAGAAWRTFSHGLAVFFGTLWTLLVVLGRVTGEHLRDAWDHLMALFGRE